jgi:hypothetical protein
LSGMEKYNGLSMHTSTTSFLSITPSPKDIMNFSSDLFVSGKVIGCF